MVSFLSLVKSFWFNINYPLMIIYFTDNQYHRWIINVVKVKKSCQSQMADGHLGQAQMANAVSIGHLGLGSNFQPSLKCPTPSLKVVIS